VTSARGKLLVYYVDPAEAAAMRRRLRAAGVMVEVDSVDPHIIQPSKSGTQRIGLWVSFADQFDDAVQLLQNPHHVPRRIVREGDGQSGLAWGEMNRSARSLFVFAIYLLLLGTMLVLAPNVLLALFQVPATDEVWVRVLGVLVIFLGIYDLVAARHGLVVLIAWTVPLRLSVIVFFAVFVFAGLAPPVLLLFGVVDFIAAVWTWHHLRSELAASESTPPA
jgi:hypothetical protein